MVAPLPLIEVPARHRRLLPLPQIGSRGIEVLRRARVVIVGLGALGSVEAATMARMGAGTLVLVDRDLVEPENLGSQVLYDAADATEGIPKAAAAARRLAAIDPAIALEPHAVDLVPDNAPRLLAGADLVLDGTDNFETRFLINDVCVRDGIPWVYAGVIGHHGQVMAIRPGHGPCLRCYVPERPLPGTCGTCDVDGVLPSASQIVANLACAQALRLLLGGPPVESSGVLLVDAWEPTIERVALAARPGCPCCERHAFDSLAGTGQTAAAVLCGRQAVQVAGREGVRLDFGQLARSLSGTCDVSVSPYLLRVRTAQYEISLFSDARAIVKGTDDPAVARSLYARLFGL